MLFRFLVSKYLRFDKTQPFISITALLAFLGVGVGIMVLIVAMAIMEGMIRHFEERLFVMNYPLTIFATQRNAVDSALLANLESKFPHLKFSPYVRSQGAVKLGSNLNAGLIFGIDFKREIAINKVLREKNENLDFTKNSIILGERAIRNSAFNTTLNSAPVGIGSKVTIIFTQLQASGLSLMPQMRRFSLDGTFSSGLNAYDEGYMYMDIGELQKIRGVDSRVYDGIHIYSANPTQDIESLRSALPQGASIVGWWQQNGNFFSAIALEKRALFIVLMLIIIMASLNIISSLMMVIMTRRREIALLLSLGASKRDIQATFFWLGNVIGFSGIVFGAILAGVVLLLLSTFPIISLPADVYGSSKLPLYLSLIDFAMIIFGGVLVVLASSFYPSRKAAQINPLATLRSE
ncbi:ABC transporter permease [Helicobacter sp. 23-1045]